MTIEIVGTLRNARRITSTDMDPRAPCLSGEVYGDTKGRFRDGDWIVTSRIKSEDGDVFQTTYSAYRVESWAEEPVSVSDSGQVSVAVAANDNAYDKTDKVRRLSVLLAGPMKLAAYTALDPTTGEHGPIQFHMTYDNTVMAVMGENAARLFASFVNQVPASDPGLVTITEHSVKQGLAA